MALGLASDTNEEPAGGKTTKVTKFEMPFPAALPVVGPGALTPMKNVLGDDKSEALMVACTSLELTTVETKSVLLLLPLKLLAFQVTMEPATNPEPRTMRGLMSCFWPEMAPLGLIDRIDEVIVGEAPRLGL